MRIPSSLSPAALPERLVTNGEQGSLAKFQQFGSARTLRQNVVDGVGGVVSSIELIETPDQVAGCMGEVIAEVDGDGFLITTPVLRVSRRYVVEITYGLIPVLQKRGLTRSVDRYEMLRDHPPEF
jgi:alkanesulfonate monooxygenase SsuD/methylene tetrahydromethanopterin reductase-like flavin-dependent oxidoreductase (luciferase family)